MVLLNGSVKTGFPANAYLRLTAFKSLKYFLFFLKQLPFSIILQNDTGTFLIIISFVKGINPPKIADCQITP